MRRRRGCLTPGVQRSRSNESTLRRIVQVDSDSRRRCVAPSSRRAPASPPRSPRPSISPNSKRSVPRPPPGSMRFRTRRNRSLSPTSHRRRPACWMPRPSRLDASIHPRRSRTTTGHSSATPTNRRPAWRPSPRAGPTTSTPRRHRSRSSSSDATISSRRWGRPTAGAVRTDCVGEAPRPLLDSTGVRDATHLTTSLWRS